MSCTTRSHLFLTTLFSLYLGIAGCTAEDGAPGAPGAPGLPGSPGTPGEDGASGGNVEVTNFHGEEMLLSTGDFDPAGAGKYFATATVSSATAAVDGTVTVNFTIEDKDSNPVAGVTGVDFTIVKLQPASGGESFNQWVPYIYRTKTVKDGVTAVPGGTKTDQGYRESNGTFTDNADGSYTYVFATNISSIVTPVGGKAISYDRNLTHRVTVQMGGHSGATAEAVYDFVPDGSPVTQTRNIIATASCQGCHGEFQFSGHGGDRLGVEGCVTCHNPSTKDPYSDNTVDMKVMIHKIHAGGALPTVHGADGLVWDDPGTVADESADNGEYAIYGYRESKHEWSKVEFPAVIENCTKCHQGTQANVDNWKTVPSRAVCGSCHDDVDFAIGHNIAGVTPINPQLDDNNCSTCHKPDDTVAGLAKSITTAHDWTKKDQRHIPEFDVTLTVSDPGNGTHFVAGESPVVTVKLTDVDTGSEIDYTSMTKESNTNAEGCLEGSAPCPALDNAFTASGLYVHGPRARRVPVLTTTARVELIALNQATYDLSTIADDLSMTFDGGKDVYSSTTGLSAIQKAKVSVDLTTCTYVDNTVATAAEIVTCLNADTNFAARGIAYIDEASSLLAIRSRNLKDFYSLQLDASDANTAVFNNTTIQVMGGYTVSATLADNSDPKTAKSASGITYTLDPVDDLEPGTYMVGVEITDRGRVTSSNYKTPSVKKALFQVKQATEEKAIANNCDSCHQGPQGTGYVLDFYRHNKIFDHTAVDQCGQCHDYQSRTDTADAGSSDGWNGSRPIGRRVHAIHHGAKLNFPLLTVNYGNDDPVKGRNWEINFPRDILSCEVCHSDDDTSGTWKTKAARSPCSGCHDSEATTAHLKQMTYDPTPLNPWSGDEEESCQVCH